MARRKPAAAKPVPAWDWPIVTAYAARLQPAAPAFVDGATGTPEAPGRLATVLHQQVTALRMHGVMIDDPKHPDYHRVKVKLTRLFFKIPASMGQSFVVETWSKRDLWFKAREHKGAFGYQVAKTKTWVPVEADYLLDANGRWTRNGIEHRIKFANGGERVFYGQRLEGTYSEEVACNDKCTGALGPSCSCSCGGVNHGTGATVTRFTPRSAKDQTEILAESAYQLVPFVAADLFS